MASPNDVPTPSTTDKSPPKKEDAEPKMARPATSVKADSQKAIGHCEITCKTEKNWWDKIKPFAELGGIILLAVYTGYTIKLVHISQRSSRPFVGVSAFRINQIPDTANEKHTAAPQPVGMDIQVVVKNFGPLPALNFLANWDVALNGISMPGERAPQKPKTLNPTETVELKGDIGNPVYSRIMDGTKVLTFDITISYDGPEGHYEECVTSRYSPNAKGVIPVGPCAK